LHIYRIRSFTVFNQRFKLVQAVGGFQQSGKYLTGEYKYELFEIDKDPANDRLNGGIVGTAMYACASCDKVVHYDYVKKDDNFSIDMITRDISGEFIRPTPEAIESELEAALKSAQNGKGGDLDAKPYIQHQIVAERWAGKIGYKIAPERLKTLEETHEKSWFADYEANLGETLRELEDSCYFDLTEDEHAHFAPFDTYAGSFFRFFNALPKLNIPDDPNIKGLVADLLYRYREMHQKYIKSKKEKLKEVEEEVRTTEAESGDAIRKTQVLMDRKGISLKDLNEATEAER